VGQSGTRAGEIKARRRVGKPAMGIKGGKRDVEKKKKRRGNL